MLDNKASMKPNCCSYCSNTKYFSYIRCVKAETYTLYIFECLECGQLILKEGKIND